MQNDKQYYEELDRIMKDKYIAESPKMCNMCDEETPMVEVTFGKRKELVCMNCYSSPDYQEIVRRDHPEIKLINN